MSGRAIPSPNPTDSAVSCLSPLSSATRKLARSLATAKSSTQTRSRILHLEHTDDLAVVRHVHGGSPGMDRARVRGDVIRDGFGR